MATVHIPTDAVKLFSLVVIAVCCKRAFVFTFDLLVSGDCFPCVTLAQVCVLLLEMSTHAFEALHRKK